MHTSGQAVPHIPIIFPKWGMMEILTYLFSIHLHCFGCCTRNRTYISSSSWLWIQITWFYICHGSVLTSGDLSLASLTCSHLSNGGDSDACFTGHVWELTYDKVLHAQPQHAQDMLVVRTLADSWWSSCSCWKYKQAQGNALNIDIVFDTLLFLELFHYLQRSDVFWGCRNSLWRVFIDVSYLI